MSSHKGLFLALSAWTCFAISDVFVKLLSEAGIAPVEIVFLNMTGITIISVLLMRKANWIELKEFILKKTILAFFIASLSITGAICGCSAFALLPIPEIYIFFFMAPIVTFFIAKLVLKEIIPWQRWLVVFTAFLGVFFAYYGDMNFSNNELNPLGILYCSGAVICVALMTTLMRHIRLSAKPMGLWTVFFGVIVSLFLIEDSYVNVAVRISHEWEYAIFLPLIASLGVLCRCEACRITHASIVAVTHYFQMPVGILTGFLVWQHLPSLSMMTGAMIIITSGIILIRNNKKKEIATTITSSQQSA
ncbi:MAG: DMT family transporter [Alphaproteobacteria bacterium]|nr:DMT family transporter [Alphaproteobacteria bacterium]